MNTFRHDIIAMGNESSKSACKSIEPKIQTDRIMQLCTEDSIVVETLPLLNYLNNFTVFNKQSSLYDIRNANFYWGKNNKIEELRQQL